MAKMTKRFNWKIALILWVASLLGAVAIIPYSLTLQAPALANLNSALPPMPVIVLLALVQSGVLFAVAVVAGLFFAGRIGLGAPVLEAKLAGEPVSARVRALIVPSVVLGVAASLVILLLDTFVFAPVLRAELGGAANALLLTGTAPPAWQGFLASFYGGIDEEVLLRLFVLSLLAFLGKFVSRTAKGRTTLAVLWAANIIAAILFGLGHLPATAAILPITPPVILRAIVLNGAAGLVFGYLYFTRGLESAMLSHFSADIVLHVLAAL
jgi:membrane protease YdiL (CAAX protease family)